MTDRTDERNLIRAANRGDAEAFERLYRIHSRWVVSLACRFTGSRDDALDVLQETFSYLWSRFPGFVLTGSLRSFLYPVVKHHSINIIRRRRKVVPFENDDAREVVAAAVWHGSDSGFEDLVSELPERQREVVRLRFALDMRLNEIARALGLPEGTVKSRLHNALKTLRLHREDRKSADE